VSGCGALPGDGSARIAGVALPAGQRVAVEINILAAK
jgi:hypothetical protein